MPAVYIEDVLIPSKSINNDYGECDFDEEEDDILHVGEGTAAFSHEYGDAEL